jgi:DNA adenine methylase
MKPLLKWAGGKAKLLPRIRRRFGGRCHGTYREPFSGGLAIFLGRVAHGDVHTAVLSDTNAKLIATYQAVQQRVDDVLAELDTFPTEPGWEEHYYAVREDYNAGPHTGPRHAARLIWLNRAGYNGLYRENQQGKFNVPVGRYVRPRLPREEDIRAVHGALQIAELRAMGFQEAMGAAQAGDHVYCDPPYVPLSRTASFTNYSKEGFGTAEQILLAQLAAEAAERGARMVMSNHATPETRALYRGLGFTVGTIQVQRTISTKGADRWKAKEILAVR